MTELIQYGPLSIDKKLVDMGIKPKRKLKGINPRLLKHMSNICKDYDIQAKNKNNNPYRVNPKIISKWIKVINNLDKFDIVDHNSYIEMKLKLLDILKSWVLS